MIMVKKGRPNPKAEVEEEEIEDGAVAPDEGEEEGVEEMPPKRAKRPVEEEPISEEELRQVPAKRGKRKGEEEEEDEDPYDEEEYDDEEPDDDEDDEEVAPGRVRKSFSDDDDLDEFVKAVLDEVSDETEGMDAVRTDMSEVASIIKGVVAAQLEPLIDALNEQAAMIGDALSNVADLKKALAENHGGQDLAKAVEAEPSEPQIEAAEQPETKMADASGLSKAVAVPEVPGVDAGNSLSLELANEVKKAIDGRFDIERRAEALGKAVVVDAGYSDLSALRRGVLSQERAEAIIKSYQAACAEVDALSK
jgi:hypothetical protein